MIKKCSVVLLMVLAVLSISSCKKKEVKPNEKPEDKPAEVKKSSLKSITKFKIVFTGVKDDDVKYDLGDNIKVSVPFGTKLKGLKTEITVSEKATVNPKSGTAIDYEDGKAKDIVVTAEDGSKKTYKVTINVRGEVGSGSRIKTFSRDFFGVTTYTYSYNKANFVSGYVVKESKAKNYSFVYNAKNQITEKKNSTDTVTTTYKYNDKGQIISAEEKKKEKLTYTYAYTYNAEGNVTQIVRVDKTKKDASEYVQKFEFTKGNTTKHVKGKQEFTATFDEKNNPFKGIYPVSYAKILVGNADLDVNTNNPVKRTGADDKITYEYNKDNYPVKGTYTVFGGAGKVTLTYVYF